MSIFGNLDNMIKGWIYVFVASFILYIVKLIFPCIAISYENATWWYAILIVLDILIIISIPFAIWILILKKGVGYITCISILFGVLLIGESLCAILALVSIFTMNNVVAILTYVTLILHTLPVIALMLVILGFMIWLTGVGIWISIMWIVDILKKENIKFLTKFVAILTTIGFVIITTKIVLNGLSFNLSLKSLTDKDGDDVLTYLIVSTIGDGIILLSFPLQILYIMRFDDDIKTMATQVINIAYGIFTLAMVIFASTILSKIYNIKGMTILITTLSFTISLGTTIMLILMAVGIYFAVMECFSLINDTRNIINSKKSTVEITSVAA